MKKIVVISLAVVFGIFLCHAQSATVTVSAGQTVGVVIYEPLDGSYQEYIPTRTFDIAPGVRVQYRIPVSNFSFVRVDFAGKRTVIPLLPEDSVLLEYGDDKVVVSGNNSAGHIYYNSLLIWHGTMPVVAELQHEVLACDDYTGFRQQFERQFVDRMNHPIDSLSSAGAISPDYGAVLKREITDYLYGELLTTLKSSYLNKKLSELQIMQIQNILNGLYAYFATCDDRSAVRFNLGQYYLSDKYSRSYKQLSDEDRARLTGAPGVEAFGSYACYLLAEDVVQRAKLTNAMLIQHLYGFREMEVDAVFCYLSARFADSQSIAVLRDLYGEKAEPAPQTVYLSDPVRSLKELSACPNLKEKYCLVDLWATWCIPCLREFQYAADLHKLMASYPDIELVYLSIDAADAEKNWKELIEKFNLTGYHLLAGDELQQDIRKQVFESGRIAVPSYLLLSPEGVLLSPDLPRPSNIEGLRKALDEYLAK